MEGNYLSLIDLGYIFEFDHEFSLAIAGHRNITNTLPARLPQLVALPDRPPATIRLENRADRPTKLLIEPFGPLPLQILLHEWLYIAAQNTGHIASFVLTSQVFHELVRL